MRANRITHASLGGNLSHRTGSSPTFDALCVLRAEAGTQFKRCTMRLNLIRQVLMTKERGIAASAKSPCITSGAVGNAVEVAPRKGALRPSDASPKHRRIGAATPMGIKSFVGRDTHCHTTVMAIRKYPRRPRFAVLLLLRGEIKMSPASSFETMVRMLQRYLDDIVREPSQPTIPVYFDDAPLVPGSVPSRPAASKTCECGRYLDKDSIEGKWLFNPATGALVRRPHKAITGGVTSSELKGWQIGQQSRCTNRGCPHFRACANDDGAEPKRPKTFRGLDPWQTRISSTS